jgi:hypothetical protein
MSSCTIKIVNDGLRQEMLEEFSLLRIHRIKNGFSKAICRGTGQNALGHPRSSRAEGQKTGKNPDVPIRPQSRARRALPGGRAHGGNLRILTAGGKESATPSGPSGPDGSRRGVPPGRRRSPRPWPRWGPRAKRKFRRSWAFLWPVPGPRER